MIKKELAAVGREGMLPAGVVLTGGGSKLEGLVEYAKEYLKLPVQMGSPLLEISGLIDKLDDPSYATCVGLMIWGIFETANTPVKTKNMMPHQFVNIVDRAKGWFKNFMP